MRRFHKPLALMMVAASAVVLGTPAHAQGKSGTTYDPQPITQAPARQAPVTTTTRSSDLYETNRDDPMTGLYVGAYGGYGWSDFDTGAAGLDTDVDGGDYGLFVGYKLDRWLQQNVGITGAIEAFYGWSSADETVAGIDVEKDHEWGVNFRPGISISETINPYAIIGYRRTNYEASAGAIAGDESYDGFDLGIGTELVAWGDVGMRIDYTHTWYGEENGIDPSADNVRLGLAYHF